MRRQVLVTRRKVHNKGRFKAVLVKAILAGWQLGTVKAHCNDPVFFPESLYKNCHRTLLRSHPPSGCA